MRGRLLACLALARPLPPAPPRRSRGEITSVRFGAVILPKGVARSNLDLAEDFLDLTFALESGENARPPAALRDARCASTCARPTLAAYRPDLTALLARIRAEAGIDIAETDDPAAAQIRIEAVPAAQISRVFPTAACFIVPGETDWTGFLRRRSASADALVRPGRRSASAAIFLPLDTTPQDVRDCLNEEITQALGPANDLYRLPDSIWNDDNFHGMATPLRHDDPARALPAGVPQRHDPRRGRRRCCRRVLDRVNPQGPRPAARRRASRNRRAWATAIEAALDRDAPRQQAPRRPRRSPRRSPPRCGPPDHRLGVSLLTLGRLSCAATRRRRRSDFAEAYDLFRRELRRRRRAHRPGRRAPRGAGARHRPVRGRDRSSPTATRRWRSTAQNAILLAGLLSIKAEALAELGDTEAAQAARLDSLRWARYGFGDTDGALAREQAQLAALLRLENG